ncbi:hypothetical protein COO60DRAFT_431881 [Scenedesmus sp. NREL 46B-D3]|nr:hypothetical protein COO60DRAFT_431881 [Scenedesmus sp. NREL 46B-D3]
MYYRLMDCGVPVKHLVYNKVGHGDFVVDWPTRLEASSSEEWGGPSSSVQQQHSAEQTDDWGGKNSRDSSGDSSSSNGGSPVQQRRSLLEQLPHYLQDIAIVVMGQQQVNFVQRVPLHARRAVQLDGASAAGAAGEGQLQQQQQQQQQSRADYVQAVSKAAALN